MEQDNSISIQVASLKLLLAEKLGLRRGTLEERIKKAGRRLPSAVQRDLFQVAKAEMLAKNPKLAERLNPMDTKAAATRAEVFLKAIDVKDRRKGVVLGILGSLAFNLLAALALLILFLRWQGFV